jgi:hypothetical protein
MAKRDVAVYIGETLNEVRDDHVCPADHQETLYRDTHVPSDVVTLKDAMSHYFTGKRSPLALLSLMK